MLLDENASLSGVKGKQYPLQKYTPSILLLSTNDAKTYKGMLCCGHGYRKSEIMYFVKTVN